MNCSDAPPLVGLHDLAAAVGVDHAHRLMTGLQNREEARKVLAEQEFINMGRMDRAVEHFYEEECDGRMDMLIPPGAYIYWWLESQKRGGEPGDFWRDEESSNWFKKKNPGCVVKNRFRQERSGYTGVILEGTKYGDARKEAA